MTRLSIPLSAKPGKHRIAVDTVNKLNLFSVNFFIEICIEDEKES
jgi:hypothetical protein